MFSRLRMRPREIDRLTEVELALCLDDDLESKRPTDGSQAMSGEDVIEYARRWRRQSLAQRLKRARES